MIPRSQTSKRPWDDDLDRFYFCFVILNAILNSHINKNRVAMMILLKDPIGALVSRCIKESMLVSSFPYWIKDLSV